MKWVLICRDLALPIATTAKDRFLFDFVVLPSCSIDQFGLKTAFAALYIDDR